MAAGHAWTEHDALAISQTIAGQRHRHAAAHARPGPAAGEVRRGRHHEHRVDLGPAQCAAAGGLRRLCRQQAGAGRHQRWPAPGTEGPARCACRRSIPPYIEDISPLDASGMERRARGQFAGHQPRHRGDRALRPRRAAPRDACLDRRRSRHAAACSERIPCRSTCLETEKPHRHRHRSRARHRPRHRRALRCRKAPPW